MVKKITSAAFLLLVMINHTFCDIKPNNNQDQTDNVLDKSAKSSSKICDIKPNNITDQASSDLEIATKSSSTIKEKKKKKKKKKISPKTNVTSVLAGISTTLLVLERITFVITGKSLTLAHKEEVNPASFADIELYVNTIMRAGDNIYTMLNAQSAVKSCPHLKDFLEKNPHNSKLILQTLTDSITKEGYYDANLGRWEKKYYKNIPKEGNMSMPQKTIYYLQNYLFGQSLRNQLNTNL